MQMTLTIKTVLGILLIFIGLLQGKAQVSDFQLRTGVQLYGDISKKTKWGVETESRFANNAKEFNRILVEPTISYRIQKYMSLAVGYRWSLINDDGLNELQSNRLHLDVALHHKIKSLAFKLRSRFQYDLTGFNRTEVIKYSDTFYRHALSIDYNIFGSRFKPSVGFELFHNMDNTKLYKIEKFRYSASVDYRLTRNARISAFYMIDDEVNARNPETNYILGCSIGFRIN